MKHTLSKLPRLVGALAVVCCAATLAGARDRDLARVVSAKAGGVNHVAGEVSFKRAGAADWKSLTTKDDLKSGDAVRTGSDGRAEILLNPGSYLRLGRDTEFVFVETKLDGLRLRLLTGSAVVEATGYSDLDVLVTVETPQDAVEILRSGLYRFDAARNGASEVYVYSGRARTGGATVKGGQFARISRGTPAVAKFDKKLQRDTLDLWSRERARELAKINERLQRRSVNALLAHTSFYDLFMGSGRYGHMGVWLWSPFAGCYTFLPFATGWPSPYGFNYGLGYYGFYNAGFCTPCLHSGLLRRWNTYNNYNPNPDLGWGTGGSTPPSTPKSVPSSVWNAPSTPSAPGGSRTTTTSDAPSRSNPVVGGGKGDKP